MTEKGSLVGNLKKEEKETDKMLRLFASKRLLTGTGADGKDAQTCARRIEKWYPKNGP